MGEKAALDHLRNNGYEIICTNFRFGRMGEIDIIAQEGEYICFIEVKTRSSSKFGTPSEAVGYRKQAKILNLAQIYLKQKQIKGMDIRFDVIEVYVQRLASNIDIESINLIRNAFQA